MTTDPLDQPHAPRIRTKLNRLEPQVDHEFFQTLEDLRLAKIDVAQFQRACLATFGPRILAGHFDEIIEETMQADDQVWLVRRHTDDCRYTVLFYRVDEGEVHPPHHHHNVISTQIVVSGCLRMREYDRVRRNREGRLVLRLASDTRLGPGEHFQASEWQRNVHWFQAVEGPAIVFNINARGYEPKTFDVDEGAFGRRYLDPRLYDADHMIICEEFDEAEAETRFQAKPLDAFAVPEAVTKNLPEQERRA